MRIVAVKCHDPKWRLVIRGLAKLIQYIDFIENERYANTLRMVRKMASPLKFIQLAKIQLPMK